MMIILCEGKKGGTAFFCSTVHSIMMFAYVLKLCIVLNHFFPFVLWSYIILLSKLLPHIPIFICSLFNVIM
jgi:hypothetical protein